MLKIAVIKTDGIGDAVLASPFLFELRKNQKDARITGILSPAGAEVLGGLKIFDEIILHDARWLRYKKTFFLSRWMSALKLLFLVNKGGYDAVIGMRWQDRLTSLIVSLCRVKEKYGYDTGGMGFCINHKVPRLPRGSRNTDKNMEIFKTMFPGKKYGIKLGFFTGAGDEKKARELVKSRGKYIVIHPVSNSPARNWPLEKYRYLAERLARKYPVYVVGAGSDGGIKSITGKNIFQSTVGLSIREMGAVIKNAALVIGNDSAAVHIAAAFGVRALTIYSGTTLYEEWDSGAKTSFILSRDVICRGCELYACDRKAHECMGFYVDEVERAARNILSGRQKRKIIGPGK